MKLAVLIPARDEGGGIAETVRRAREAAGADAPVFVVADRGEDDTAARARGDRGAPSLGFPTGTCL
jgi:hypothetical protein